MASSYTHWGDILSVQGDGSFTFGYFGSMMDAATGLLYIGNGQYYDPATGRFINGGNQLNTLPVMVDPAGMFLAPLSLLPLMFGGKKKKKRTKLELLLILMVVSASLGISLTACMPNYDYINNPPPDLIPTPAPLKRENLSYSTTTSGNLPSQTYAPTLIPVVQYRCISPARFFRCHLRSDKSSNPESSGSNA